MSFNWEHLKKRILSMYYTVIHYFILFFFMFSSQIHLLWGFPFSVFACSGFGNLTRWLRVWQGRVSCDGMVTCSTLLLSSTPHVLRSNQPDNSNKDKWRNSFSLVNSCTADLTLSAIETSVLGNESKATDSSDWFCCKPFTPHWFAYSPVVWRLHNILRTGIKA